MSISKGDAWCTFELKDNKSSALYYPIEHNFTADWLMYHLRSMRNQHEILLHSCAFYSLECYI